MLVRMLSRAPAASPLLARALSGSATSRMFNRVTLVGNIGRAPEFKQWNAQSSPDAPPADPDPSQPVEGNWNFSVATRLRRKQGDNWVDESEWHKVRTRSDISRLTSGQKVLVEGELRSWRRDDKSGYYVQAQRIVALERGRSHEDDEDDEMPPNSAFKMGI
ncbi:hypothetical protein HK105_204847 [Polyrhizophydium stewartii]|uniref:Single-stranded DNA-binding protein n=1 Tax=Polyrhizophydium stewartii TaxID=2732419 RepID=A0ABR4N802_9FUNG